MNQRREPKKLVPNHELGRECLKHKRNRELNNIHHPHIMSIIINIYCKGKRGRGLKVSIKDWI